MAFPTESPNVQVGGKSVQFPEKAYSDLQWPLLNTVELRSEVGYDQHPWLYIVFETGFHTRMASGNRSRFISRITPTALSLARSEH